MRLLTGRFFLAGMLLSSGLFAVGHAHQSSTPPQATRPATDPILGAWKLDIDKSTNPTAEAASTFVRNSAEPMDCTARLREMRAMMNRPLPPGATRGTTETTFQGSPAFESFDPHTNGPKYLLYDLTQFVASRTYRFHARWLSDDPKPEEVTRIFDSFKLLTKEND